MIDKIKELTQEIPPAPSVILTARNFLAAEALSSWCRWLREYAKEMPDSFDKKELMELHDLVHAKMVEMQEWRKKYAKSPILPNPPDSTTVIA